MISEITGCLTQVKIPSPLRKPVLSLVAAGLKINPAEAEHPFQHYQSIDAFFTRGLKPDVRPLSKEGLMVSPCDGQVLEFGQVQQQQLIQAKGLNYALNEFLQLKNPDAFDGGNFATIYLSPADCHRIFTPMDCELKQVIHVPGKRLPVREPYISKKKDLYVVNERLIFDLETEAGRLALVMVGALNVGQFSMPYAPELRDDFKQNKKTKAYPLKKTLKRGEWLGTFHMGSTVVLVSEFATGEWGVTNLQQLNYGESILS